MDKKKILLVSLGHLSCDVNSGAVPALLPFLIAAYGFDYQAAGGLVFALACLGSVIQPALGYFADRASKPWFIPLGVLMAGCGIAAIGFLEQYWAIFAAVALSGVGAALFHPEAARYASKVSGDRKGLGLSIFSIGGNSGMVVGPVIVIAAVGGFGLHGTIAFAFLSFCTAGTLLYQISHLEKVSEQYEHTGTFAKKESEGKNDWKEFSKLTGSILARAILFTGFNTFIPLYWIRVFGQSEDAAGFILTCYGTFGVISNLAGGFFSDRIGYIRLIRLSCVIMVPVIFLFSVTSNQYLALALLAPLGFSLYAPFSSMVVLGQKYLGRNVGFASGVTLGLAISVGGVTVPFLGWIADTYGLPLTIQCMGGAAVVGAFCSFLLSTPKKNATE